MALTSRKPGYWVRLGLSSVSVLSQSKHAFMKQQDGQGPLSQWTVTHT